MSKNINNKIIKEYLLGQISDEVQLSQIEDLLSGDKDFFQRLELVEDELIEKYNSNKLVGDELLNFEKAFHLSGTRRKKIILSRAINQKAKELCELEDEEKKLNKSKGSYWNWFKSSPKLAYGFAIPVILLTLFSLWFFADYSNSTDDFLAQIDATVIDSRPFESRIINFKYLPYSSIRGENKNDRSIERKRRIVETKLLEELEKKETTENFNALGVYYLVEKKYDEAIKQFTESLRISENNSNARGNLGAAYFEKSKNKNDLDEKLRLRAKALEEITKAINEGDERQELLFNKALIIQSMNMPKQAILAWEKYLEKDQESKWADEARKNIEVLNRIKTSSFKTKKKVLEDFMDAFEKKNQIDVWKIHSQTKEVNTQKLIPMQLARSFLDASRKEDLQKAKLYLDALIYIGELEKDKNTDVFFADLAEYYSGIDDSKKKKYMKLINS